jgi:bifunctional non-homologous end joining protein LigD
VIDGEIVVLAGGRPSFAALRHRMHVGRPGQRLASAIPVTYMAFDLLQAGDRVLLRCPYEERRALLEELVLPVGVGVVPPAFPGDAAAVWQVARELGIEGVVLKRLGSRYEPGHRSRAWLKMKNRRNCI